MRIVAVCGQLNSGKGAVSDIIMQEFGYVGMAFADPIKRMVQQMFGIPDEELWGPSHKRSGKVRSMLQELGTDFAHKYDPAVWVNLTVKRIKHWDTYGEDLEGRLPFIGTGSPRKIVITDLRFPNEAQNLCTSWATKIFKVVRPGNFDDVNAPKEHREHASETVVNNIPENMITVTLHNDKHLAHLHNITNEAVCSYLNL